MLVRDKGTFGSSPAHFILESSKILIAFACKLNKGMVIKFELEFDGNSFGINYIYFHVEMNAQKQIFFTA
jgi:hypothetical protein